MANRLSSHASAGFTLLEVLVALVIVCTALGAGLRAVGSLAQNSRNLQLAMLASWSAENHLTQIRLSHAWPDLGKQTFDCSQGDWSLRCEEIVEAMSNSFFRRVSVSVYEAQEPEQRLIQLTQVVANAF